MNTDTGCRYGKRKPKGARRGKGGSMANTFMRMEKKTTLPSSAVEELKARIAPYMDSDPHNVDGAPYMLSKSDRRRLPRPSASQ